MTTLEQAAVTIVEYYYCDAVQLYILELQHQQVTHVVQAPSVSRLKALFKALLQEQQLNEQQYSLQQNFADTSMQTSPH